MADLIVQDLQDEITRIEQSIKDYEYAMPNWKDCMDGIKGNLKEAKVAIIRNETRDMYNLYEKLRCWR